MVGGAPGHLEPFSLESRLAAGYFDRAAGWLVLRGTPLLRRAEFPLAGDHNVQNALAAASYMAYLRLITPDRSVYVPSK